MIYSQITIIGIKPLEYIINLPIEYIINLPIEYIINLPIIGFTYNWHLIFIGVSGLRKFALDPVVAIFFKNWQKNYKWWSDPVVFWNALDPVVILFAKNMYVHSKNHKFKINHFWTGPSAFQRKITMTGSDHHL